MKEKKRSLRNRGIRSLTFQESANSPTINHSLKIIKKPKIFYGNEFTTSYFLNIRAVKTVLVLY